MEDQEKNLNHIHQFLFKKSQFINKESNIF